MKIQMIYWVWLSMGGQRVSPRYVADGALKGFSMYSSSGLHVTVLACFVPFLSYNSLIGKLTLWRKKSKKKKSIQISKLVGAGWFSLSRYLPPRLMTEFHMVEWENWLWNVDFWPHKRTVAHVYILYHRIDNCYFFQKNINALVNVLHAYGGCVDTCVYLCEPCCVIQCCVLLLFPPRSNGMVHAFTIAVVTNYHYLSDCFYHKLVVLQFCQCGVHSDSLGLCSFWELQ